MKATDPLPVVQGKQLLVLLQLLLPIYWPVATHLSLSLLCRMDSSKGTQEEDGSGHGSSKRSSYLCRQSSTRWMPTADQIRILKELYYSNGLRSPTAEQIQRISATLRQYGRIEGKNVFYWFQNHKARERQKKRLGAVARNTTAAAATHRSTSIAYSNFGAGQECRRSRRSFTADASCSARDGLISSGSSCTSETGADSHGLSDPGESADVTDGSTGIVETLQLFPLRGGDDSGTGSGRSRIGETYPGMCFGVDGSDSGASLELNLSSFAGGGGGMRGPCSGRSSFLPSGS